MNFNSIFKPVALAILGLILATTASLAAQSTTSLNVRSGPNSSYRVVDVLHPGEHVTVKTCRTNGWCRISHRGPDGWVSSRYLTNKAHSFSKYVVRSKPRLHHVQPSTNITINIGSGFGWSIVKPAPRCIRRYGRLYCR